MLTPSPSPIVIIITTPILPVVRWKYLSIARLTLSNKSENNETEFSGQKSVEFPLIYIKGRSEMSKKGETPPKSIRTEKVY